MPSRATSSCPFTEAFGGGGSGGTPEPLAFHVDDEESDKQAACITEAIASLSERFPDNQGRFDYFNIVVPEMERLEQLKTEQTEDP